MRRQKRAIRASIVSVAVLLVGCENPAAMIGGMWKPAVQYTLSLSAGGGGTILNPATNTVHVEKGVAVSLRALPGTGYAFSNWIVVSGAGVTLHSPLLAATTVALNQGDAALQASFRAQLIRTIAGTGTQGFSGDGAAATAAAVYFPQDVAVDASGDIYVADYSNQRIRRIDHLTGTISTFAGTGGPGYSGDGGPATSAMLQGPTGVALDGTGNLYIADATNQRVRRVDHASGTITTVAGNGTAGYLGDGGPAISAELNLPFAVAVNGAGNLYIADALNNRVRMVAAGTGMISTVAGNGTGAFAGDSGPALSAELWHPAAVDFDGSGNLYIADLLNSRVREVDAVSGVISTVAGTGSLGFSGDGGPAKSAALNEPDGLAVDKAGNIYIADYANNRVRRVDQATGAIGTVAGTGTASFSGDSGTATSAALNLPGGLAIDASGQVFIADVCNNRVRQIY